MVKRWADLVAVSAVVLVVGIPVLAAVEVSKLEMARRIRCASNLRQLGQAILLYCEENKGAYPRTAYSADAANGVGGAKAVVWGTPYEGAKLGAGKDDKEADPFAKDTDAGASLRPGVNDVTAAMYLLMRTEDISSEVFICPSTGQTKYEFGGGSNNALHWTNFPGRKALRESLSYSYANPYGRDAKVAVGSPMNSTAPTDFAVMADMNPGGAGVLKVGVRSSVAETRMGNSLNHNREAQNVMFTDGRVELQATPMCGVNRDNIYTYGSGDKAGVAGSPESKDDSVLLPAAEDLGIVEFGNRPVDVSAVKLNEAKLAEKRAAIVGKYVGSDGQGSMEITGLRVIVTEDGKKDDVINTAYVLSGSSREDVVLLSMKMSYGRVEQVTVIVGEGGLKFISEEGAIRGDWKRK